MTAPARLTPGLSLALLLLTAVAPSHSAAAPLRRPEARSLVGPDGGDHLADAWERDEQLLEMIVDRIEASEVTDEPTMGPTDVSVPRKRGKGGPGRGGDLVFPRPITACCLQIVIF